MFNGNNSALTIATHDIIPAIDDVTAITDDVIHIICTLLSHHNSSCYGIMTSHFKMSLLNSCYGLMTPHFKMSVKTKDFCVTSNKYCRI